MSVTGKVLAMKPHAASQQQLLHGHMTSSGPEEAFPADHVRGSALFSKDGGFSLKFRDGNSLPHPDTQLSGTGCSASASLVQILSDLLRGGTTFHSRGHRAMHLM